MQQVSKSYELPNLTFISRWVFGLSLTLLLFAVLAPVTHAQEIRTAETIQVTGDEVIGEDVYAAGSTMIVDGVLEGDLLFAGEKLIINGTVADDLWFGGQELILNGQVIGDIRMGGTAATLAPGSSVGGDLLMGGLSLDSQAGSVIEGNVLFGGYQAILAGDINKDVKVSSAALEIRGNIAGDVNAKVGTAADMMNQNADPFMFNPSMPDLPKAQGGLTIADSASIGGDLNYASIEEFSVPSSVVAGDIKFDQQVVESVPENQGFDPMTLLWKVLREWATLILIGLLLVWLLPRLFNRSADNVGIKPLLSLGWGVVALIATPILLLVGMGIVIFLAVIAGLITLPSLSAFVVMSGITTIIATAVAFGLVLAFVAKIIVGYGWGRIVFGNGTTVADLIVGLLLVVIAVNIPVAGGIIGGIIVVCGLGAIWLLRDRGSEKRLAATPASE